jgi:2,4-dienoyl-CoA reductase-like NADH-dependent reductase (Old Yellow Enzyme family)
MAATDSARIGRVEVDNRLYRAPLLERAGDGPDAGERVAAELEPAAAAGAGLVCQGAMVVRGSGGCVAPKMTRIADDADAERLAPVPDAVNAHGARVFAQLDHGGLRSLSAWHAGHSGEELAAARPPRTLRALDRLGFLNLSARVLSARETRELAADFGRAARRAVEAGYDGVHLGTANGGLLQQFLSPYYNRRGDAFGGDERARLRLLALVHDEIRDRAGDVPLMTKVPCEDPAPPWVRRRIDREEAVRQAERLAGLGYDALVPVECSVFWDASIVRGAFPARSWRDSAFREGYRAAFGRRWPAVAAAHWAQSLVYDRERRWNAEFCRAVSERVSVPVCCEGGVRSGEGVASLLDGAADFVGMGRPFYAEPDLPRRVLAGERVACHSCNNCVVPQAAGAPAGCRTPAVIEAAREARDTE